MNKLSYDATWTDLVAMTRANASVLIILAGAFLFLPNFAQLLLAPMPEPKTFDWNAIKAFNEYFRENMLVLILCKLPVWLGTAGMLSLLLDPRRPTVGEALSGALSLLIGFVLLDWLTQLIAFGGLFLLLIPGIYIIGRLALAAPAQMAERLFNPVAAITRSFAITKGNGWRTSGILFLFALILFVAGAALQPVAGIVFALILPATIKVVMTALLKAAINAVAALVITLLSAALYRQLASTT